MQPPVPHKIFDQTFWLSAMRCLYWEEQKALVLSDLHFGKTGHFRKAGIAVPQSVFKEDLQRLLTMIHYFKPQQVIAVGDLFHSHANLELDLFKRWRANFPDLIFNLVKGNHDILKPSWYTEADIVLWDNRLSVNNIHFSHEDCVLESNAFTFCGHLHPGVVIHGMGKQSLRFPCFYFTHHQCILPAYSRFTGLANVAPKKGDAVYAIVENTLIKM